MHVAELARQSHSMGGFVRQDAPGADLLGCYALVFDFPEMPRRREASLGSSAVV
jgi:hypothetical protein